MRINITTTEYNKPNKANLRVGFVALILFCLTTHVQAQNCTINAGVDFTVCDDTQGTLMGVTGGLFDPASITWTQISGPAATIVSPTTLSSSVTGLVAGNTYQFQLSLTCNVGGTVSDIVDVNVVSAPVFTAGPDDLICNSSPYALSGTLPAGFTGNWTSSSGGLSVDDLGDPNSSITLTNNCFTSSMLSWTITNGTCTYSDIVEITVVVSPVNAYITSNPTTLCGTKLKEVISCAPFAYSTTTITPVSEPFPANVSIGPFSSYATIISVTNMNAIGTYSYAVQATSSVCPGTFIDTIIINVAGIGNPNASWHSNVSSTPQDYFGNFTGSGFQKRTWHCETDFANDFDTIWFYADPATPPGGTNTWTVSNTYILDDPNADTTFAVHTGAFLTGSVEMSRIVNVGSCTATRSHRAFLFEDPDPVYVPDTVLCSGSSIRISAADGLAPVYGYISLWNAVAYLNVDYITQLSGPTVSVTRAATNNSINTDDYFEFSGLSPGNEYVFTFSIPPTLTTSLSFPYYNCYAGPTIDTFTIVYPAPLGASSGTSQLLECDSTSTELAGAAGVGQNGVWSMNSGPILPTFADASNPSTSVSGMSVPGDYIMYWDVTNLCGEVRQDSTLITIPNCSPLGVELLYLDLSCVLNPTINWATSTERNNSYFTIERSFDGVFFEVVGTVQGAGNSNNIIQYSFTDESFSKQTLNDIAYYRISQTDYDGTETELGIRSAGCEGKDPEMFFNDQGVLSIIYGEAFSYNVYTMDGKLATKGESNSSMFSMKKFASGVYIIQVRTSNGEVFNEKKICSKTL